MVFPAPSPPSSPGKVAKPAAMPAGVAAARQQAPAALRHSRYKWLPGVPPLRLARALGGRRPHVDGTLLQQLLAAEAAKRAAGAAPFSSHGPPLGGLEQQVGNAGQSLPRVARRLNTYTGRPATPPGVRHVPPALRIAPPRTQAAAPLPSGGAAGQAESQPALLPNGQQSAPHASPAAAQPPPSTGSDANPAGGASGGAATGSLAERTATMRVLVQRAFAGDALRVPAIVPRSFRGEPAVLDLHPLQA